MRYDRTGDDECSKLQRVASTARCRHCRAPLRHTFVDLGMSPLCESYRRRPTSCNHDGAVLPAACVRLRQCFLVQLQEYVAPDDIFTRLRLFLLVLRQLARARPSATPTMIERWLRLTRSSGRGGREQRRLSAAVLRRARHSGARHRAGGERAPRSPIGKGIPTAVRVLRPRDGRASSSPKARQADLLIGNNVLAHVPDLNDFVGGMKILLKPDGVDHDGVPASAAADGGRTSSTRSTTSTSPISRC